MEQELVSIITPCYNSTEYVSNLLNSILSQDYLHIELIIVDDGSTDDLEAFLHGSNWFERFHQKGYALYYFYQENQGQSVAINLGLDKYKGNYLTWPDSDDFYKTPTAISTFVKEIEANNVDVIRCYPSYIGEDGRTIGQETPRHKSDELVFYDCLLETDFWFSPICYFFKSNAIRRILGNRIMNSAAGQNFQFYLPVFFYSRLKTLELQLVCYLVRENSHSHQSRSVASSIKRLDDISNLKYALLKKYHIRLDMSVLKTMEKKKNRIALQILMDNKRPIDALEYAFKESSFSLDTLKIFLRHALVYMGFILKNANK